MKRQVTIEHEEEIRMPGGEIRKATIKRPVTVIAQCQNCKHVEIKMIEEPCASCGGASGEYQLWEG